MRVRLLGGLTVEGMRPAEIGSRKARRLLSVLALGRQSAVPVDRIVDAIWPERPPANPAEQVGVLVSRLRGVFGPDRFERSDTGWTVHPDWLDLDELAARVEQAGTRLGAGRTEAALVAARGALMLIRGELLADEPDAAWAAAARAETARLIARARLIAAEAELAAGDPDSAALSAALAMDHDPYDEVALRALMRAHRAAGRPGSALAAFAAARRRLIDDLGVDPSEPTVLLHLQVLRGGTQDDAPAPRRVAPTGGDSFVGREADLARLEGCLSGSPARGGRLVVLEGEAGIGKTTLVTRWAVGLAGRAAVLVGRCDELGRDLALQPILDALDLHLRRLDPSAAAAVLGADAGLLDPLLGTPTPAAPGAAETRAAATTPGDITGTGKALLYAALLRSIQRCIGDALGVLVIDDVHLAGPGTVEWLRFAVRRGSGLLVLALRRPGLGPAIGADAVLRLGPLDLEATRRLVGADRAGELHERSRGNPLFLVQLRAAPPGALPDSVRESVLERADRLGPAGATLRAAALLDIEVDLDLLAGVVRTSLPALLDHLDLAVRAQLLEQRGRALRFGHELVREALAAAATAARQEFVHAEAARVLAARPRPDPLALARHARLAGQAELAAAALRSAAEAAVSRHDVDGAQRHLDEAVMLHDGADNRLARARLRLTRLQLTDAAADAQRSLALGAGAPGLELAGWIAYYRRDQAAAERFARAGLDEATDPGLRASCAALLGRSRHTQGDLARAEEFLTAAAAQAPAPVRGVATVWLASLRCHQGRPAEAVELAERSLVAPDQLGHPFAAPHAMFAAAYSLGLQGRVVESGRMLDRLEGLIAVQGEQAARFVGLAANLRGWLWRSVGRLDEADDSNARAVELPAGQLSDEPRAVGLLDLAEGRLAAEDPAAAQRWLDRAAWIETWSGSMAWHQRHRYQLLRARLALAANDPQSAHAIATAVAADARKRGARRYHRLAELVAVRAAAAHGEPAEAARVTLLLSDLAEFAGLEAWWVTAEVAAATSTERWWRLAERRADVLILAAGADADPLRTLVTSRFAALGRR